MESYVEKDLQEMLPELEALLQKGVFTKKELKQVLKTRARFEQAIRGTQRTLQDFYQYLEYEQKLEELRKIRVTQLKSEGKRVRKSDLEEFCIVRHIHSIFSRATFVFKSEIGLWKQWFGFCQESHSPQRLSKALSDALRYNPCSVELWIYAAYWELEERQNVNIARSLMQQGLRNCRSSEALWLTYFKMELTIAEKLWERQQILETSQTTESGLEGLVDGSMALCVFREAISVLPSSLEFRKQFLDITAETAISEPERLIQEIFATIQADFKDSAEMWDMSARYLFLQNSALDLMTRLEASMEVFSKGLTQRLSSELYSCALMFLNEIWHSCHQETDSESDSDQDAFLAALFQQMESILNSALDVTGVTEAALVGFLDICKNRNDLLTVLNVLQKTQYKGAASESVSQLHIEAIQEAHGVEGLLDVDEASEALLKILEQPSATPLIWKRVLEALCEFSLPFDALLSRHLHQISKISSYDERQRNSQISCFILESLMYDNQLHILTAHCVILCGSVRGHVAEALEWAEQLMKTPFVEASVYLKLIELFSNQLTSTVTLETLRSLCEKAIRAHGASDVEIWITVLQVEHQHGNRQIIELNFTHPHVNTSRTTIDASPADRVSPTHALSFTSLYLLLSATPTNENRKDGYKLKSVLRATDFGAAPLFAASVVYVLPFYFLMVFRPREERTRALLSSPQVLLPVAVVYSYLLFASWQPDTLQLMMPGDMKEGFKGFNPQFFPKLQSIQILFSRVMTAASLWVHIVAVNFFFARSVFLEGIAKKIPTQHSCLCALFLGPVAVLMAAFTEAVHNRRMHS